MPGINSNTMQARNIYVTTLLLFLFALGAHSAYAQEVMPPFKKGTDTAAISKMIRAAHAHPNVDSAIALLEKAAQKSIDGDYYLGATTALVGAGSRYADQGKYTEAMACATRAKPYADKSGNITQIAFGRNLFGVINFLQGDYVRASAWYIDALSAIKNVDSNTYRAAISIYTNMATVSSRLKQKDKQLYYLQQGEVIARNEHITAATNARLMLLAGILINKGNYYDREIIPDSSMKYYYEVLDMATRQDSTSVKWLRFRALAEVNLASAMVQKHEYDKAVTFSRSAMILSKGKFQFLALGAAYTLGEALRNLKKYGEAEAVLLAALKENRESNTRDEMERGYATLAKVYRDSRQFEQALDITDSLMALKDTMVSAEKTRSINQLEAKYHIAERDRKIAMDQLLIAQQKNNIAVKNVWIAIIIAAMLVTVSIVVARQRINKSKQAALIRSLKQENTISILKGVVQGEENERIRLARDLHDGIGGMLSATKMRFMTLKHDNNDLGASHKYQEAMGLLDMMGDEIRKTSHNLMPEVLLKQDLAEAIHSYCNNMKTANGLHVTFQGFGSFEYLANDLKLNVYRIVQELLKNIVQHAGATSAHVQMMMLDTYLTISVEDNGKGFNEKEQKDGIGLHNLKARVLSHEGHYTIKSDPGRGTTVYVEFAIAAQEEEV